MIKRFSEGEVLGLGEGDAYNDMVISARVSNHKNFLKLLGCCLEFPLPVLVFDGAENGVLDQHGDACNGNNKMVLSWNQKLKIAKEVANAVTYLHTAFPRIIVHRDIKPMHIFLDKNWTPKLSDMLFSISLPEGKTQMVDKVIVGTFGYMDPSYLSTRLVTEYTDVFSFGILLLVLLIGNGRAAVSAGPDGQSVDILCYVKNVYVNSEMKNISDRRSRKREVVDLALRCCEGLREDRPTMIHVAKALDRIEKSIIFVNVQDILDQNRLLINEINQNHESNQPENLQSKGKFITLKTPFFWSAKIPNRKTPVRSCFSFLVPLYSHIKKKARKCFLKNGSMFLQKLIADCNGISTPIRMFSYDQITLIPSVFSLMIHFCSPGTRGSSKEDLT
ncbi:unnamed protein product [Brassica rapa subsp. trilocularis]